MRLNCWMLVLYVEIIFTLTHCAGIDFFIGLPYSENYRCAKVHEFPIFNLDTLTASRYYPSIWSAFTDSSSLISKVLDNPKEFHLVSYSIYKYTGSHKYINISTRTKFEQTCAYILMC